MADLKIKPDEITTILKERIEGLEDGGSDLSEVGTVLSIADGIARIHGLDNCMSLELRRAAARRHRPRAEPRVGQRRPRAVRRVGQDRGGRHRQADGQAARDPGRRGPARPHRRPARAPARRQGRAWRPPRRAPPSSRRRASSSASRSTSRCQTGIKAIDSMIPIGRGQRELIIGDRQTGKTAVAIDTIINNRNSDIVSRLRGDRPAHGHDRPGRRDAARVRRARQHDHRRRAGRRGRADQVHRAVRRRRHGGVLPLQGRPRPVRVRRPDEARVRVPPDVAAAAPPAGPRGVPGRRLLPALTPARARGEAERRPRRAGR